MLHVSAGGNWRGGKFPMSAGAKAKLEVGSNAGKVVDRASGMRREGHQEKRLTGAFW